MAYVWGALTVTSRYYLALAFTAYLILVQLLRFSRLRAIKRKYGGRWTTSKDGKRKLDVTPAEAQEIMHVSLKYDLPGVCRFSTLWALFNTYAIPSISEILVKSGELSSSAIMARRYTDTGVLISSWATCPIIDLTSIPLSDKEREERGKETDPRNAIAIARVNWLHSRWPAIKQEDYLYTLSLFLLLPMLWAREYGWRALSPMEEEVTSYVSRIRVKGSDIVQAYFVFWSEIGRRMRIEDIPETLQDLKEWSRDYEETHMVYAPTNYQVGAHTIDFMLHRVPKCLGSRVRNFARELVISAMNDRIRIAFGLSEPSGAAKASFRGIMQAFAFVHRYLSLPRIKPHEFTASDVPAHVFVEAEKRGTLPRQHPCE